MTWPSLPAFSANNFIDHFPGSSLDSSKWTTVTSGSGAVTVTDSYVDFNAPANNAAFMYYNAQLDKTKSQLWTIAYSRVSGVAGGTPSVLLVNGSSAPAADTSTNIDAKTLVAQAYANQTTNCIFEWYFDNTGSQFYWGGSRGGNTWAGYASNLQSNDAQLDDYYVLGIELDGVNARWRTMVWGSAFGTAGTYRFEQGWRLFSLSDWVAWSATRASSNIWLAIGQLYTDDGNAKHSRVEWVRYAEALTGNTVLDAWCAGKQALVNSHQIRHVYSYDGITYVPNDRTSWAITLGAGAPDNSEIQEPWAVYDGASTDYIFYTGTSSGTKSICVASASHVAAGTGQNASFTKYGSNPILTLGSSGQFDDQQIGFACVVVDPNDSNPNKLWKMLYVGQKASDSKHRIGYATAPAATGPWTKQGMVLDVGSAGSDDENEAYGVCMVYYNGNLEAWYAGADASNIRHLRRAVATGTNLSTLAKDATYFTPPTTATDQALTANLTSAPGRTVTVASTTGFQVDAPVVFSQSSDGDTYSTSKIRKIVSSTQLELYHGVTGFTTTYPTRVKQLDSSQNFDPRGIIQVGSEWWLLYNQWEPWLFSALESSYGPLLEEAYLYKHSAAAPNGATFAIDYQKSPITSRGFNSDQESFENMSILNTPLPVTTTGTVTPNKLPASLPLIYMRTNR